MDDEARTIEVVDADGGDAPVEKETLDKFKEEIKEICTHARKNVLDRRSEAENTRFCRWEGQSADGRKHAEDNGGKPVKPFEGASDGRLRIADMIVNERSRILVTAATRGLPKVRGMEARDSGFAGHVQTLLKWLLHNQLGGEWRRMLRLLTQYQEGDSPAAAVLEVTWRQEWGLVNEAVSLEGIAQFLQETYQVELTEEDVAALEDLFVNEARTDEALAFLESLLPEEVARPRLRKILKGLREEGAAEFPSRYLRVNLPCWKALRIYRDVWFADDTTDLQAARVIYRTEWLSEADLKARKATHGYSESFIEEVMKHKGKSGFPRYEYEEMDITEYDDNRPEANRDRYEVVTAYFRAVSEDDWIPAWYLLPFHCEVEEPAAERQLLDYAHGLCPFIYFPREVLTDHLLDSRGVPELAATDQSNMKLLNDTFMDHAQVSTLPPLQVPRGRPDIPVIVAPLAENKIGREKIVPIELGQYPATNDKQQTEVWRRTNLYFARYAEEVPEALAVTMTQGMVDDFLWLIKDGLMMTVQLCQQYLTDEQVARITGSLSAAPARSVEEIQGKFDMELTFDVRALDMSFVESLAKVFRQMIAPLDREQVLMRHEVVRVLLELVSPSLADRLVQPLEAATQKEVDDEDLNFVKMLNGIEPPMMEEGQNFPLRLQVLQARVAQRQQQPELYEPLTPATQEMIETRMKHLEFMTQQEENAEIGRVGAEPTGL